MSVAPIRYSAIRQDMWRGRVVATLSWLLYRLICAVHHIHAHDFLRYSLHIQRELRDMHGGTLRVPVRVSHFDR
jgi:hypothetical protein